MCIYLGELEGLHYDSADHIIPAGLGGIKKLPLDFVSREFNNLSSKYERGLMKHSILSLPRQLHGPGKRGSLSSSKATTSSVHVFRQYPDNSILSLGYIKMGKPFEIPHLALNVQTGELNFAMSKDTSNAELQFFKKKLAEFDTLKVKNLSCRNILIQLGVGLSMVAQMNLLKYLLITRDPSKISALKIVIL